MLSLALGETALGWDEQEEAEFVCGIAQEPGAEARALPEAVPMGNPLSPSVK